MPDGAFDATERQFLELLGAASGPAMIEVSRHTMDGVPRGDRTSGRIADQYEPVAAIAERDPDLLIVTGSNPLEREIENEPYWEDLASLISWGTQHASSMLLSCLSAHAALTVLDDVRRERLATKCTGVFPQQVDAYHALGHGMRPEIRLPHSRTNTVADDAVCDAGYRVVIGSKAVGWGVATREIEACRVVLVQGHPEYDPSSLLREYLRDARRWVTRERDDVPPLPHRCVSSRDWARLERLHERIVHDRDPELLESFPFDEAGVRAAWPWRAVARRLYANLLTMTPTRSV
jgi:homoserine O-succinyltransferase